ncbi:hypothetical protein, partial [Escherichia coli]|uniref:hypothetical protein n=1 Tax=Escherichia coli TaxID=562 RepID=UPI00195AD5AA
EKRVFLVILFTSFSGSLVSRISGAVQTASDQYAHNGGEYHETVLYTRQSGGDVLIIGVYAHRTRYDNVLCGYTNHMYLV